MLAALNGRAQIVRLLIDAHANIEAVNTDGFGNVRERVIDGLNLILLRHYSDTPLMLAVMEGHAQVVRTLIDAHANLEAVNNYGFGNVRESTFV